MMANPVAMQTDAEAARSPTQAAGDTDDTVARLEALLVARSGEVRALNEELARVRVILRDAVGRPAVDAVGAAAGASDAPGTSDAELVRLREERDRAVARAVAAEAARVEASFALDEARGQLAVARVAGARGDAGDAMLAGRERGLRARLAETLEQRDVAEARRTLLEDDFAQASRRVRELERELAEAQERIDLAVARAARPEGDAAAQASLTELRGELAGLRARSEEAELAFESARVALGRAQAAWDVERGEHAARIAGARAALAESRAGLQEFAGAVRAVTRAPEPVMEPTLVGVDAPASTRPPRAS
jgi:chromosome segregation ATPase